MQVSELLPCPFCGGEAEPFNPFGNTNGTWCVLCSECASATGFEQTEAEAIAAWNSRADYHGYEQAAIEAWESIKAWNSRAERTCKQEERGWGTEGDHARMSGNLCFIGNIAMRSMGVLLVVADSVVVGEKQRAFIMKQREWYEQQQDMMNAAEQVDELMGENE